MAGGPSSAAPDVADGDGCGSGPTIADLPPWAMARLFDLAGSLEQQATWGSVCTAFNTAYKVRVFRRRERV
jgi:hypothetical protein